MPSKTGTCAVTPRPVLHAALNTSMAVTSGVAGPRMTLFLRFCPVLLLMVRLQESPQPRTETPRSAGAVRVKSRKYRRGLPSSTLATDSALLTRSSWMHRIPSPAVLLLAAVLAPACAQEDAPAADFIIGHDSVTPVANTGPPSPARLDLVAGRRHLLRTHERLPHRGYPERRRRHRAGDPPSAAGRTGWGRRVG